jgi:hypothetical protein
VTSAVTSTGSTGPFGFLLSRTALAASSTQFAPLLLWLDFRQAGSPIGTSLPVVLPEHPTNELGGLGRVQRDVGQLSCLAPEEADLVRILKLDARTHDLQVDDCVVLREVHQIERGVEPDVSGLPEG